MTMLRTVIIGLAVLSLGVAACAEQPGKKKEDDKADKDKKNAKKDAKKDAKDVKKK